MSKQLPMLFQRRNLPAWLVLVACLALLVMVQNTWRKQMTNQATQAFNEHSQNITDAIVSRLNQHEQILLGGAGLFNASQSVDRNEWHAYIERLQLAKNYPGILGVGYSQVVKPSELAAHIASMRAEGFPEFSVRPTGERPPYTPIIFLEPFSGRNLAAFGYDMMSEPTRSTALHLAVDKNTTSMTAKVKLVQENQGKVQAGFLMYVPIYRKHMPLITATERWKALQGYVYSPYRMNDLMHGIMGQQEPLLDFSIYDGETTTSETEMYVSADDAPAKPASHVPLYVTSHIIKAYGHAWTVNYQSRPEFENNFDASLNWPLLLLGSSSSVMLFLLISMLTIRNIKAEQQTQLLETLVTERTNDLRAALDLQTAVLDNAAYAIIATNPEGLITIFNKTAEKILGYSASEMIGKQTPVIIHDAQQINERALEFSKELNININPGVDVLVAKTRQQLPNEHEWNYVRENGSQFPVNLSITALRNDRNIITGFIYIATDITEKKSAKQALIESAQHTQTILDNVADGIITINQQGIIESFNHSAENIFGYTAKEVIGQSVGILMPEKFRIEHDSYLKRYNITSFDRIVGTNRETDAQHKNGTIMPMDMAVSRSTHHGQPLYIGLVRDITERKRIDQMKAEFVSTVSHELRTPLTAISGSLGLISGGALGNLPAQIKQMIDLAHKNALRLTSLINDLLDMEKLIAGKMQFDNEIQPLKPLIEQTLQSVQAYAEQFDVQFNLDIPEDDILVRVDGGRLQQVLTNFLSNAAKFSPPRGNIDIRTRIHNNKVRVEVIDKGPGITREFRKHIFQKFSQADSSDSRQKGGTGLGLAISKELIERMHGEIGFISEPGEGSCFYFQLPVIKLATTQLGAEFNHTEGAPRLLVVEDEPDIGRLFAIMLNNAGYNVDIAHNAESAQAFLSQHHYDAMTLDLMLPDQSGINLIRQIRSRPATQALPIIVISAYSADGKLAVNADINALDWLEKPINSEQLITAMKHAINSSINRPRVLHVEDDVSLTQVIATMGHNVADFDQALTLAEAHQKLIRASYDLVIIDIGMPDGSGWDLLPVIESLHPKPAVIVLSSKELTETEKMRVQQALIKSGTSNDDVLALLKQMLTDR
ncbi:MAG: CHASE domain-containing protein [Gammaproteobacteria bacterium]|nr:CHASE domain-containing protein [Gammaproteobacteria bacterium]